MPTSQPPSSAPGGPATTGPPEGVAPADSGGGAATATPTVSSFGPGEAGLLVLLSLMWGLSFLFMEVALREIGPFWIVAGRTTIGGLVLLTILLLRRRRLPRGARLWGRLLTLGLINNAAPWTMLAWAQQTLPSGLAGLLMAIVPTSTLVVAALVGLERITTRRLAGLLLALGGVGVIVAADIEQPGRVAAVAVVVLATMLYASGAVFAKSRVSGHAPPLALATGQVLTAAVVTVPLALVVDGPVALPGLSLATVASVTALGAFGTGLAFLAFYTLVARVGATNATLTTYLIPIVAVIAGAVVLDERLGPSALVGGVLILIGIWLAQRPPGPARSSPTRPGARGAATRS